MLALVLNVYHDAKNGDCQTRLGGTILQAGRARYEERGYRNRNTDLYWSGSSRMKGMFAGVWPNLC